MTAPFRPGCGAARRVGGLRPRRLQRSVSSVRGARRSARSLRGGPVRAGDRPCGPGRPARSPAVSLDATQLAGGDDGHSPGVGPDVRRGTLAAAGPVTDLSNRPGTPLDNLWVVDPADRLRLLP